MLNELRGSPLVVRDGDDKNDVGDHHQDHKLPNGDCDHKYCGDSRNDDARTRNHESDLPGLRFHY
jgi:hypothetical protein